MLRTISSESRLIGKSLARARSSVASINLESAELADAKSFEDIPKILSLPVIGTTWAYMPIIGKYDFRKFIQTSKMKNQEYGNIVREDLTKQNRMVHLFDAEDIEKVYRNDGKFPERRRINSVRTVLMEQKEYFSHMGILNENGEPWWDIRKEVQPHMLKPRTAISYLPAIDSVAKEFVERMSSLRDPKSLEIKDYYAEINRFTLEAVGLVALDARLGCLSLDIPLDSDAKKILDSAGKLFDMVYQLEFKSSIFQRYRQKQFRDAFVKFTKVCQKYLHAAKLRVERQSKDDQEMTILEQLLAAGMDPKMVAIMINDIFFAGIDTTSNSTGFFLYHMCRNPEHQEKVYEEIKTLLPNKDSPITADVLNNARYIKACVKESMRLFPVVVGIGRILHKDLILSGYRVPAGTQVVLHSSLTGLSEKYFDQADRFDPERWLRKNDERQATHPFALLPFGFGPRACIGRRIAEQELYSVIIRVFQRYRLEYHHEDIDGLTRLVNTPDKPLRFQFHDRP